eukprot:g56008.t1
MDPIPPHRYCSGSLCGSYKCKSCDPVVLPALRLSVPLAPLPRKKQQEVTTFGLVTLLLEDLPQFCIQRAALLLQQNTISTVKLPLFVPLLISSLALAFGVDQRIGALVEWHHDRGVSSRAVYIPAYLFGTCIVSMIIYDSIIWTWWWCLLIWVGVVGAVNLLLSILRLVLGCRVWRKKNPFVVAIVTLLGAANCAALSLLHSGFLLAEISELPLETKAPWPVLDVRSAKNIFVFQVIALLACSSAFVVLNIQIEDPNLQASIWTNRSLQLLLLILISNLRSKTSHEIALFGYLHQTNRWFEQLVSLGLPSFSTSASLKDKTWMSYHALENKDERKDDSEEMVGVKRSCCDQRRNHIIAVIFLVALAVLAVRAGNSTSPARIRKPEPEVHMRMIKSKAPLGDKGKSEKDDGNGAKGRGKKDDGKGAKGRGKKDDGNGAKGRGKNDDGNGAKGKGKKDYGNGAKGKAKPAAGSTTTTTAPAAASTTSTTTPAATSTPLTIGVVYCRRWIGMYVVEFEIRHIGHVHSDSLLGDPNETTAVCAWFGVAFGWVQTANTIPAVTTTSNLIVKHSLTRLHVLQKEPYIRSYPAYH